MSDGMRIAVSAVGGGLLLMAILLGVNAVLAQRSVCAQPAICITGPSEAECRPVPATCRAAGLSTQAVIALSATASIAGAVAAALARQR